MRTLETLDGQRRASYLADLECVLHRFNRSGDDTLVVSADYLEVVMMRTIRRHDMFELKGKVAIVTGGNGGIGLGMARGLAQAPVRAWSSRHAKREKSETAVRELGGDSAGAAASTWPTSNRLTALFEQTAQALRTHRHSGEQRRHQYPQAGARSAARGMEAGHGHQPHQRVPVLARRLSASSSAPAAARSSTSAR